MFLTNLLAQLRKMNVQQSFLPFISGEHLLSGKRPQAEKRQYLQIIARNPQDDEPHHRLALLLFEMGDRHGAEDHLRSAIHLNPGSAAAHFDLGALLREDGRITEAELEFEQAWRLEPLMSVDRG